MARKSKSKQQTPHESLSERIHDRIVSAEVAAEEAAGFGSWTTAVEAVEGAADPDREAERDEPKKRKRSSKPAS
jgi:hypothetical protein